MEVKDVAAGLRDQILGRTGNNILFNGPKRIDNANFRTIEKITGKEISCFVDGGNLDIIRSNSINLQLVRACGAVFEGNVRKDIIKEEFFVLTRTEIEGEDMRYIAKCYGTFNEEFIFDAYEPTLREGNFRVEISKIGETVRRYFEVIFMSKIIERIPGMAYLVRDGKLRAEIVGEEKHCSTLLSRADEKGIILAGVAKTNSIITDHGIPASSALIKRAPPGRWQYLLESGRISSHMAKLNENSRHVLYVESTDDAFSMLAENSSDAAFPGYPYGLVMADRMARVSFNEGEYYKTRLMAEMGKDWERIKDMMTTRDAHDILDNMG
ncbi:DNA double-strand break repair nuclease NurA [Candidatus Woesearchaeota archaeon]|nr:DNA double-strand break repair nuclease NurA [Candidatus Woesearchaeota archaeon]